MITQTRMIATAHCPQCENPPLTEVREGSRKEEREISAYTRARSIPFQYMAGSPYALSMYML